MPVETIPDVPRMPAVIVEVWMFMLSSPSSFLDTLKKALPLLTKRLSFLPDLLTETEEDESIFKTLLPSRLMLA